MSILINGCILPPDDRMDLVLCIQHDGTVLDPWGNQINTKAIELPPHGRLIDADALLAQYKGSLWTARTDYAEGLRDVANDIKNAPTIIPAEGGADR